jgi:hypothetical protein
VIRSLAAGAAVCVLLAGCGEPSAEEVRADYCETVKERQRALSDRLADGSPTALLDAQPIFRDLADAAPGDIADDWRVLLDAIEGLDGALTEAGVDPATYDPGKPPADLTDEQREDIERAAAELLNPRTEEAVAAVDQQARDVCQTPLFQ